MRRMFLMLLLFASFSFCSVESINYDFRDIVSRAKDEVFPSVVYIKCRGEDYDKGEKKSKEVSGSGVIVSADGDVVTNWHVIDKAFEIRCLAYNGQDFDAEIVGSDKDTDLALIKLKLKDGQTLPFAKIGNSQVLNEGDFVMAMGAPWGMSRSVSIGIISCKNRYLPGNSEYNHWLQTDAAISPGNSGGPLINTNGEIIGINTRGVIIGGDMGFAIPSECVKYVIERLKEHGDMNWTWFGFQLSPLKDFDKGIYFDYDSGVVIQGVLPQSPAQMAGFLSGDRILQIDSQSVTALTTENLPQIRRLIAMKPKGQMVEFKIKRKDQELTISVEAQAKGKLEGKEFDCKRWDMTLKEINRFENPNIYFYKNKGLFVYSVKYPGNAHTAGFREHDIILKVDGQDVEMLEDIEKIHSKSIEEGLDKKLNVTVLRNGLYRQLVLDIARDYEKE